MKGKTGLLSKRVTLYFLCLVFGSLSLSTSYAQPGTVKSFQKISATEGNFSGILESGDYFGQSVADIGDLDGDLITDLAVGAYQDDESGFGQGALWILFMNADGTIKGQQKITEGVGGFTGNLREEDRFGSSVTALGDLDGDGVTDLAVGAQQQYEGSETRSNDGGAVWILFLNSNGTVKAQQEISDTEGGFSGTNSDGDYFGGSVSNLGDFDGDGVTDLAVSAAGNLEGAVWLFFLNSNGTIKADQKITEGVGGFTGNLVANDSFGSSIANIGDLNGDGVTDLAVGMGSGDDGGFNRGALWLLFMNADGTVKSHQKISDTEGGFTGILNDRDSFGLSVATLNDLDGDQITDLAVGARDADNRGAIWVLFLNSDGTVKTHQKISDTEGGFGGMASQTLDYALPGVPGLIPYNATSTFGLSVADNNTMTNVMADISITVPTGGNNPTMAVTLISPAGTAMPVYSGASSVWSNGSFNFPTEFDGENSTGVWQLEITTNHGGGNPNKITDGTLDSYELHISFDQGNLMAVDLFGDSVAGIGDLDGDGVIDIAVGAKGDDDGGRNNGAIWILNLQDQ